MEIFVAAAFGAVCMMSKGGLGGRSVSGWSRGDRASTAFICPAMLSRGEPL